MLTITPAERYFLYASPTDLRKGFDSLCGLVKNEFKMNPQSGDVFIFLCRTKNKIKLLQWQNDGFAIYYKRLEKGTFEIPKNKDAVALIPSSQLMLIMEGIQLCSVKKRVRYEPYFVDKNPVESRVSM